VLAARMSPRKLRPALPAAIALKGAYFDEHDRPDEAGSSIIKTLGIYPVGSHVQLVNGEVAVVLRRGGAAANKPWVASVITAYGTPCLQPVVRDTRMRATAIVRGVPPGEVRTRFPVARLLKLLG